MLTRHIARLCIGIAFGITSSAFSGMGSLSALLAQQHALLLNDCRSVPGQPICMTRQCISRSCSICIDLATPRGSVGPTVPSSCQQVVRVELASRTRLV